jgi:indole-3-glycerol phosphate synthase
MAGFLDEMAEGSRARLEAARAREPLAALRARCADLPPPPPLRRAGGFDLIAELKLRSPALGTLASAAADPRQRVREYAAGGAAAVSVLTEPTRFDGSLAHLSAAAAELAPAGVPAMRKDFLVDPYQLHEARAAGAGGALLIIRMLSRATLTEMLDSARELGLFVLLEAFDASDLAVASDVVAPTEPGGFVRAGGIRPGPHSARSEEKSLAPEGLGHLARTQEAHCHDDAAPVLVGVNSRDLQTLEVVPARFAELAPLLPRSCPRVAESGIEGSADVERAVRAGYDMALVGGALMRAHDPALGVRELLAVGRAVAA